MHRDGAFVHSDPSYDCKLIMVIQVAALATGLCGGLRRQGEKASQFADVADLGNHRHLCPPCLERAGSCSCARTLQRSQTGACADSLRLRHARRARTGPVHVVRPSTPQPSVQHHPLKAHSVGFAHPTFKPGSPIRGTAESSTRRSLCAGGAHTSLRPTQSWCVLSLHASLELPANTFCAYWSTQTTAWHTAYSCPPSTPMVLGPSYPPSIE